MLFLLGSSIFIIAAALSFRRTGVPHPFSKGIATAFALSLVALVCLGQNVAQGMIPDANDGIGISNPVAYWIIGEGDWSIELFQARFEQSIFVSLSLIILYPVTVLAETRIAR